MAKIPKRLWSLRLLGVALSFRVYEKSTRPQGSPLQGQMD
jgi:hypothetical protein